MRYLAFRTVGLPAQIVENIRVAARRMQLTAQIPVLKVQRRPQREFYLFLGLKCEVGELPEEAWTKFLLVTRLRRPVAEGLDADAIAGFVGRAEIETFGLNSLPYQPFQTVDLGEPFDAPESGGLAEGTSPDLGDRAERLLRWISAAGWGSWQTFVGACVALGLIGERRSAGSLLRQLVLLGHLELSADGRQWCVAPGAVVASAADPSLRFLAGARTSADGVAWDLQPDGFAPPRARWLSDTLPTHLPDADAAATRLTAILPDLDGWKASLSRLDRLNANAGPVEYWDGRHFLPCRAFIDQPGPHQSPTGLYRHQRGRGEGARSFVAFFDAAAGEWLQGDWDGLCFLAQQETGSASAIHEAARRRLFVPAATRWPMLYEKTLVLASGLLPSHSGGHGQWLCYEAIPDTLAQQLTGKLNVPLEYKTHA